MRVKSVPRRHPQYTMLSDSDSDSDAEQLRGPAPPPPQSFTDADVERAFEKSYRTRRSGPRAGTKYPVYTCVLPGAAGRVVYSLPAAKKMLESLRSV